MQATGSRCQSGLEGWHLHMDWTANERPACSRTQSLFASSCKTEACGMWLQEAAISQWAQSGNRTEREQAPFTQVLRLDFHTCSFAHRMHKSYQALHHCM